MLDTAAKKAALNAVPYGLYIIGSKSADGEDMNGMTANWFTQVSFDPPLVALSLEATSHTRKLVEDGQVFTVNLLDDSQKEYVGLFVKPMKRVGNKFEHVAFHEGETGAPILDDALAYVECTVQQVIPTGDHVVVIGQVVAAGTHLEGRTVLSLHEMGWHYGG